MTSARRLPSPVVPGLLETDSWPGFTVQRHRGAHPADSGSGCMIGRSAGSAPRVDTWRFRPRSVGGADSRYEAQFRARLIDALRSGQGLRPKLELELTSGPTPTLTLRTVDPGSTRWFSRVVSEAYAPP